MNITNQAISASAGTGKTFRLAIRYIMLLAAGASPDSIVALTFSRKAATEIFDRIMQRLTAWAQDPKIFTEQGAALGVPNMTTDQIIGLMRSVVTDLHRLPIGTIDSFLVRIIRTFPFEFGLSGEFSIIDDARIQHVREEVFRDVLGAEVSEEEKRAFVNEFKRATFGREEKRLRDLLHEFVGSNHEALLDTLHLGAWGNPEGLWPTGKSPTDNRIDAKEAVTTIRQALNRHPTMTKRTKWYTFLSEAESFGPESILAQSESFFEENLLPAVGKLEEGASEIKGYTRGKDKLDFTEEECRTCARLIRHVAGCLIENALQRAGGIQSILTKYEEAYDRLFRRRGQLTFSDITHVLSPTGKVPLLSSVSASENRLYVDYRLDSTFDHWLLDEFQDTSLAQWSIIRNLVEEIVQSESGRRSFFYVGDIKQAIYGWRGGDAGLFNAIHDSLKTRFGNFELNHLTDSWRSSLAIVDTVNHVFDGLINGRVPDIPQDFVTRWEWLKHGTNRKDLSGYATLREFPKIKGESKADVLERKCDRIAQMLAESCALERGLTVAILTRTNATGRAVADSLAAKGIPATLEGAVSVLDSDVVKAILSLVRWAHHPGDTMAREHVAMTPLGPAVEAFPFKPEKVLREIYHGGFAPFIAGCITAIESLNDARLSAFSVHRLAELISLAEQYDSFGNKDCLGFCDFVANTPLPSSSLQSSVQILTVHKSKGLEFDMVFLPELQGQTSITKARLEGIQIARDKTDRRPRWATVLPKRAVAESDETLGRFLREIDGESFYEELCVLYVAMTRAARTLHMMIDERGKTAKAVHLSDVVRNTLISAGKGSLPREGLLFETGDATWYESHPVAKQSAADSSASRECRFTFAEQIRATSPSQQENRGVDIGGLFTGASTQAMGLGTAAHELLEQIDNLQVLSFEKIAQAWLEQGHFPTDIANTAVDLCKHACMQPEFKAVMTCESSSVEIWRERCFEMIVENKWVTGVFDRVKLYRDAYDKIKHAAIIDFKTDHIPPGGPEEIKDTYRPQLELYRKVLARLVGIESNAISLQLALVRTGEVVEVG